MLLVLTGVVLGFYYETNDDLAIIQLLRGNTAATPVTNLHLYFHGLAWVLAGLFRLLPNVPWYGVLLYGLLYAATALTFAVLDRLVRHRVAPGLVTLLLVLFYSMAWVEHAMWFNYMRVPLLLAGAGLLYAAQRPEQFSARIIGIVAFGLSWLIRPSAADLALLLVVPGVLWLGGRRAVPVLAAAVAWALIGGLAAGLLRGPEASTFRTLDVLKSNVNDYQLYRPMPRTPADSLGVQEVEQWLLGDSVLINEAFFSRVYVPDARYFTQEVLPQKLLLTASQLVLNYFPVLFLILALQVWVATSARMAGRGRFWLLQVAFLVLLFGLGSMLKLPSRLALPVLDLWVLTNLVFLLRDSRRPVNHEILSFLLVLLLAAAPYGYKLWHRQTTLTAEQLRGRRALARFRRLTYPASVVVTDAVNTTYKSQNPLRVHTIGSAYLKTCLNLTGWPTLDPSQPRLRQRLTGTRDFTESLRVLARRRAAVKWYLTPGTARLLNQHLAWRQQKGQPRLSLRTRQPGPEKNELPRLYIPVFE
ncbi:hypothetical protein [Hymenobacter sp. DG25A]|uniref:hypothetical protein n=1 Tax=Hymenobacter sp. DG25A TaxID=1385663 RepID=UPI0006BE0122|nr:hypothetical protein [Hymenobacter sp. DG25A]ALD21080.1 hypothetical protein AM218_07430 [Hymenobacter sp. DG25A]